MSFQPEIITKIPINQGSRNRDLFLLLTICNLHSSGPFLAATSALCLSVVVIVTCRDYTSFYNVVYLCFDINLAASSLRCSFETLNHFLLQHQQFGHLRSTHVILKSSFFGNNIWFSTSICEDPYNEKQYNCIQVLFDSF